MFQWQQQTHKDVFSSKSYDHWDENEQKDCGVGWLERFSGQALGTIVLRNRTQTFWRKSSTK